LAANATDRAEYEGSPSAMVLIDRAIVAYRDLVRITGWVATLRSRSVPALVAATTSAGYSSAPAK
jgi:hypothetical protein